MPSSGAKPIGRRRPSSFFDMTSDDKRQDMPEADLEAIFDESLRQGYEELASVKYNGAGPESERELSSLFDARKRIVRENLSKMMEKRNSR